MCTICLKLLGWFSLEISFFSSFSLLYCLNEVTNSALIDSILCMMYFFSFVGLSLTWLFLLHEGNGHLWSCNVSEIFSVKNNTFSRSADDHVCTIIFWVFIASVELWIFEISHYMICSDHTMTDPSHFMTVIACDRLFEHALQDRSQTK